MASLQLGLLLLSSWVFFSQASGQVEILKIPNTTGSLLRILTSTTQTPPTTAPRDGDDYDDNGPWGFGPPGWGRGRGWGPGGWGPGMMLRYGPWWAQGRGGGRGWGGRGWGGRNGWWGPGMMMRAMWGDGPWDDYEDSDDNDQSNDQGDRYNPWGRGSKVSTLAPGSATTLGPSSVTKR